MAVDVSYKPFLMSALQFRSPQWTALSLKDRENIGVTFAREGEFWYVHVLLYYWYTTVNLNNM